MDLGPVGQVWAINHQNIDSQGSGRIDFGARASATRVLGHNQVDLMFAQQRKIFHVTEWASGNDNFSIGKWQLDGGLVDQSQQIEMLWISSETIEMHSPDGQQDTSRRLRKAGRRCFDARGIRPSIPALRNPSLSRQRDQRYTNHRATHDRIVAHLGGKWVGGIDNMREVAFSQVLGKTLSAAISTFTNGNGLRLGGFNTPGKRHHSLNTVTGNTFGQRAGLNSSTKYQEVWPHA